MMVFPSACGRGGSVRVCYKRQNHKHGIRQCGTHTSSRVAASPLTWLVRATVSYQHRWPSNRSHCPDLGLHNRADDGHEVHQAGGRSAEVRSALVGRMSARDVGERSGDSS